MIIARSPLRITLGGGGTDLPSYYRHHGGFLLSACINHYVYVSANRSFSKDLLLRYSEIERIGGVDEVRHPIFREALRLVKVNTNNLEITTMADIPAGTGMGSSGSFTTALLKALYRLENRVISQHALAELACHIEIELLGEPVGKQDQFVAAYGGVNCFEFHPDDRVSIHPLHVSKDLLPRFKKGVLLFCTGITREAPKILKTQDEQTRQGSQDMIDNLHYVKELGHRSKAALESEDLEAFGRLLDEHWQHKKKRSSAMTNEAIEAYYRAATDAGALGGKLIGAGGGGFLMFYTEAPLELRNAMAHFGLSEVDYDFDFEGTRIL